MPVYSVSARIETRRTVIVVLFDFWQEIFFYELYFLSVTHTVETGVHNQLPSLFHRSENVFYHLAVNNCHHMDITFPCSLKTDVRHGVTILRRE